MSEDKIKGMYTCDVCGRGFPHCGCQNVVNKRLREPEPGDGDCPSCDHEKCGCREGGKGVSDGE